MHKDAFPLLDQFEKVHLVFPDDQRKMVFASAGAFRPLKHPGDVPVFDAWDVHDYLLIYFDNVVVSSPDFQCHLDHLEATFQRPSGHRMKLQPCKCHIFQQGVKSLGHVSQAEVSKNTSCEGLVNGQKFTLFWGLLGTIEDLSLPFWGSRSPDDVAPGHGSLGCHLCDLDSGLPGRIWQIEPSSALSSSSSLGVVLSQVQEGQG